MSKNKKTYDAKELFLRGLIAFGRIFDSIPKGQVHRTKDEDKRRRKSHAKFKAQCTARRAQRVGQVT